MKTLLYHSAGLILFTMLAGAAFGEEYKTDFNSETSQVGWLILRGKDSGWKSNVGVGGSGALATRSIPFSAAAAIKLEEGVKGNFEISFECKTTTPRVKFIVGSGVILFDLGWTISDADPEIKPKALPQGRKFWKDDDFNQVKMLMADGKLTVVINELPLFESMDWRSRLESADAFEIATWEETVLVLDNFNLKTE